MGMFTDEVPRLLKKKWTSPQELAEEIFALLSSDTPIKIDSPVELTGNPQGVPPLTIINQTTTRNQPVDPIVTRTGGLTTPDVPLPDGTTPLATAATGTGGNAFAGRVVGKVSGTLYTCQIWGDALSGSPGGTVSVSMLNLDGEATLKSGSYLVVLRLGANTYYGFPNVFLDF